MKRLAPLVALFVAPFVASCGASGADHHYDQYDLSATSAATSTAGLSSMAYGDHDDSAAYSPDYAVAETVSADRSRGGMFGGGDRNQRRGEQASQSAPPAPRRQAAEAADDRGPGVAPPQTEVASNDGTPPLDHEGERALPLLIYTGAVNLAIYDVDDTKEAAIAIAERVGGYAAERTDQYLTLRVPAEHFRATLDALGELGDVLSLTWDAQDVTDQFNDIEVRIRNARQMRERLEALLLQAETVPDALAIERELERITLDIERLEGQRRQMADRIAFSTITVYFSRLATSAVPGEEYRLPFSWLNQLGVERLLSL